MDACPGRIDPVDNAACGSERMVPGHGAFFSAVETPADAVDPAQDG